MRIGFAAQSRHQLQPLAIGLAGIAVLTASSYASVPMYPVPMTLQTLAVLALGALLGPRAGTAVVLSWLGLAALGAPVLAGGKAGLSAFAGPTAGYLLAFAPAAFTAGWLVKSRVMAGHLSRFAGFLGLHTLILASGAAWLSVFAGWQAAFVAGVVPFLLGAALKSGLGAAILALRD
ncbi:MAG: biotin transporter BioY [Pseudomonadota bacterium]